MSATRNPDVFDRDRTHEASYDKLAPCSAQPRRDPEDTILVATRQGSSAPFEFSYCGYDEVEETLSHLALTGRLCHTRVFDPNASPEQCEIDAAPSVRFPVYGPRGAIKEDERGA